jgi:hypothetical protein
MASEKEFIKVFQEKYERFAREHGELLEQSTAPLDESDRKRAMNFFNFSRGLILFAVTVYLGLYVYFGLPQTIAEAILPGCVLIAFVYTFFRLHQAKKKVLTRNEKTVIKGVITSKIVSNKRNRNNGIFTVQLSNREEVNFIPADYWKYTYGDIVQFEFIGSYPDGPVALPKVVFIGKLPIDPGMQWPRDTANPTSVWAKAGRYFERLLK